MVYICVCVWTCFTAVRTLLTLLEHAFITVVQSGQLTATVTSLTSVHLCLTYVRIYVLTHITDYKFVSLCFTCVSISSIQQRTQIISETKFDYFHT